MASSEPTSDGGYELAAYPNCSQMYRGKWEGQSIFAVGRLTTDERLFKFTQLAEASSYANTVRAPIESLPSAAICQEAVEDLYD